MIAKSDCYECLADPGMRYPDNRDNAWPSLSYDSDALFQRGWPVPLSGRWIRASERKQNIKMETGGLRWKTGISENFQYPKHSGILRLGRVSGPVARADFKSVGGRSASSVGSTPASSATSSHILEWYQ